MKKLTIFFFIFIFTFQCFAQITASASVSAVIMTPQVIEKDSLGNFFVSGQEDQIYTTVIFDSLHIKKDSTKMIFLLRNEKGVHQKNPGKILFEQGITNKKSRKRIINIIYE